MITVLGWLAGLGARRPGSSWASAWRRARSPRATCSASCTCTCRRSGSPTWPSRSGFVASIAYLARRRPGADRLAHAACEVGTVFLGVTIATGAIWGKPTWGTWWTWDARLTSVAVVFVMFLALPAAARQAIEDRERGARYARGARHRGRAQHPARALLRVLVAHAAPAAVAAQAGAEHDAAGHPGRAARQLRRAGPARRLLRRQARRACSPPRRRPSPDARQLGLRRRRLRIRRPRLRRLLAPPGRKERELAALQRDRVRNDRGESEPATF